LIKKEKILVIAAHPDDEVLGCGGSMHKWANQGKEVNVLIIAEGVTSRDNVRERKKRSKELDKLKDSALKANQILGVKSIKLLDFPDNRLDSVDLIEVVKSIEKYISKLNPNIIVTHHSNDLNVDHKIVNDAVFTACRPKVGNKVRKILSFEVPSSTEWASPSSAKFFAPNYFENISENLEYKINALKFYESEMLPWPNSRSIDAVKHLASWRGASIGCDAAEAFMLLREIN